MNFTEDPSSEVLETFPQMISFSFPVVRGAGQREQHYDRGALPTQRPFCILVQIDGLPIKRRSSQEPAQHTISDGLPRAFCWRFPPEALGNPGSVGHRMFPPPLEVTSPLCHRTKWLSLTMFFLGSPPIEMSKLSWRNRPLFSSVFFLGTPTLPTPFYTRGLMPHLWLSFETRLSPGVRLPIAKFRV